MNNIHNNLICFYISCNRSSWCVLPSSASFCVTCKLLNIRYLQQVTLSIVVSTIVEMRRNDPIIPKLMIRGSAIIGHNWKM